MAIGFQPKPGFEKPAAPKKTDKPTVEKIAQKISKISKKPHVNLRKHATSFRVDWEVVEFFQKEGRFWQTRMNDVLLEYVRAKRGEKK